MPPSENFAEHPKALETGDGKIKIADTQKCPFVLCDRLECNKVWHRPCSQVTPMIVRRLWSIVVSIGVMDIVVGIVLIVMVSVHRFDYDKMYGTEGTKIISHSTLAGLIALSITGLMLLWSSFLEKRMLMLISILVSTLLGGYIFVLSILKIHYAFVVLEQDPVFYAKQNKLLLCTASGLGIWTLLASVAHFTGTVTVFTYYNLRFVYPAMFSQMTR